MARILILIAVAFLSAASGYTEETVYKDLGERKTQNATITHVSNALGVSRIYDYATKTIAYKDYLLKKCYVERMNGQPFWTASRDLIEFNVPLTKDTILKIGGPRVSDFCFGWVTHLIVDPLQDNEIDTGRIKRNANNYRSRVRGQTQSQYLNFGNGNGDGRAEAESTVEGSKAVVSGSRGMGQAQSQSSPFSCADCYGQDGYVTGGTQQQNIVPGAILPGQQASQITGQYPGELSQGIRRTDDPRHGGNLQYKPSGTGSIQEGGQQQYPGGSRTGPSDGGQQTISQYGGRTQQQGTGQYPGSTQQPSHIGSSQRPAGGQYPQMSHITNGQIAQQPIGGQFPQQGQGPSESQVSGRYPGSTQHVSGQYPGGSQQVTAGQQPGGPQHVAGQYPGGSQQISGQQPGTQHVSGQYPGGSQQVPGQQPGGSQHIAGHYPGGSQQVTGQQPGGTQHVSGQYPGGSQHVTGQQQPGSTQQVGGQYPGGTQQVTGQQPGRTQHVTGQYPGGSQQQPGGTQQITGQYPGGSQEQQGRGQLQQHGGGKYPGGLQQQSPGPYGSTIQQPTGHGQIPVHYRGDQQYPLREGQYPALIQQPSQGATGQLTGVTQPIGTQQQYGTQYPSAQTTGGQYAGGGRTQETYPTQANSGVFDGQLSGSYKPNNGAGGQFSGTFSGKYNTDRYGRPDGQARTQYQPGQISSQAYPYSQQPTTGSTGSYRGQQRPGSQTTYGPSGSSTYTPGSQEYGQITQPAGPDGQYGLTPGHNTQPIGPGVTQTYIPGAGQITQPGGSQTYIPAVGQTTQPIGAGGSQTYIPGAGQITQPGGSQTYIPGVGQTTQPSGVGGSQTYIPGVGQTTQSSGVGGSQIYIPGAGQTPQQIGASGSQTYIPGAGQITQPIGPGTSQTYIPGGGQITQPVGTGGLQTQYPGSGQTQPTGGQTYIPGSTQSLGAGGLQTYIPGQSTGTGGYVPGYDGAVTAPGGSQIYTPGTQGSYYGQGPQSYLPSGQIPQGGSQYGPGAGYTGQQTHIPGQSQPGSGYGTGASQYPAGGSQQYYPGQGGGQWRYGPGGVDASQGAGYPGAANLVTDSSGQPDDANSQAQTSVQQVSNGTQASASAQGAFEGGTAQSQVSGTYSGSGSFSASAGSNDGKRGAQTQVSGGKEGAVSSAQGNGGKGQSQAQVQLSSETGETMSSAQSGGINHETNSQVQAGDKGGMADAQANGPGSTSSQAQIGFLPYDENKPDDQNTPFNGGGTASAQSGTYTGQSQVQIQGTHKFGIRYNGAAQASSANVAKLNGKPLPTLKPFTLRPFNNRAKLNEGNKDQIKPVDETASESKVFKAVTIPPPPQPTTTASTNEHESNEEDYDYSEESTAPPNTPQQSRAQRHESLDPVEDISRPTNGKLTFRDGTILEAGQEIDGFRIPPGFRGRVANSHTVFTPTKIIYQKPVYAVGAKTNLKNGGRVGFGSGYSIQPTTYPIYPGNPRPGFVSVTKSETGSKNVITGKKTPSVYYTQSSSCGYFTNTCFYENGKKICMPKPKTNPDGSPMIC